MFAIISRNAGPLGETLVVGREEDDIVFKCANKNGEVQGGLGFDNIKDAEMAVKELEALNLGIKFEVVRISLPN